MDYLYYSSFFIGLSSLVCIYYEDYTSFLVMFCLFLTSIHYWSNPLNSLGRSFDLYMCRVFALYFYVDTLLFKNEFARELYTYGVYNVLFLFLLEHLFYRFQNPKWIVIHMGIHFYSIFTPFVLYIL
jgi:hypothetical protein